MILIGTNSIGALKYIFEFDKYLKNSYWVNNQKLKKYIRTRKTIKNWRYSKPSFVITGTSIGYKIDKKLLEFSSLNKIKSLSIVDSWVELDKRFYYKNEIFEPNYIFVNDHSIKNEIKKLGISKSKIIVVGNPILERLSNKRSLVVNQQKNKIKKIIFISQPFKEKIPDYRNIYGYDEFSCLNDIIKIFYNNKFNLTIKLHFEDKKNKYIRYFKKYKIKNISNVGLINIAKEYDLIIGMNSFLLLEACYLHNNVYSYICGNNDKSGNTKYINKINDIKELELLSKTFNLINKKKLNIKKFDGSKRKILDLIEKYLK